MAESDNKYVPELMAEKDSLDPSFVHAARLLDQEINKAKNPQNSGDSSSSNNNSGGSNNKTEVTEAQFVDCYSQKMPKVECYIKVPSEEFPSINFVGRLIGPGGATLKGIQEITRTRIAVLGKGSQRDKRKAEELSASGDPKWAHMKLPLHVKISAVGPVDQAYMGIGRACTEIMKLIQVDEEELQGFQNQQGMQHARGGGGRGGPRGRGGPPSNRGMNPRGGARGGSAAGGASGPNAARGRGGNTGTRGRGNNARGSRGNGRGASRFGPKTQGGPPAQAPQQPPQPMMPQANDPYNQTGQEYGYEPYAEMYCESYGEYADPSQAYGAEGYGVEGYTADASYTGQEQYDMSGYGYQEGGYQDPYGNGAGDQSQYANQQQSKPFRGKMMRGGANNNSTRGRATGAGKPY